MIAAAYALWRLLRPSKPPISAPSPTDLERAAVLIENAHDASANLALLGDKNLLFNPERTAFIMYQASGSSWVSMGDPVGPPALYEPLVWAFIENCDGMAVEPVFYQITPNNLPLYIDLGLTLSKLGEEARVPLDNFSLEGAARADLRHPHRRAQKDGAVFEVVPRARHGSAHARAARGLGCVARCQEHGREALLARVFRRGVSVSLRHRGGAQGRARSWPSPISCVRARTRSCLPI